RLVGPSAAEVEAHGAIDSSLLDRVLAEHAVLGVHPGSLSAVALFAVGPAADPVVGAGLAAHQEVAIRLVGDDAAMSRVEEHGVADVRAFDVPVVMKEGATDPESGRREHGHVADEPVAREVDVILEVDGDAEPRMRQRYIADERVLRV